MLRQSELFIFLIAGIFFSFLTACNSNSNGSEQVSNADTISFVTQKIIWHFEDEFSEEEQEKMQEWITYVCDCAQKVLGRYPFDLNYYFHREDSADHAVVFGHTGRTKTTHGAHFYVNPVFPLDDFMNEWMGAHEISHLALPIMPKKHIWFYEGFATYLSRKVMIEMGTLTEAEADSVAYARIGLIKYGYESNSNFIFVADSLGALHHYPELYWGGGSYFHKIDRELEASGKISLVNVVKYFQMWAHQSLLKIDDVIIAFDKISQSTIFSDLRNDYSTLPAREILTEY